MGLGDRLAGYALGGALLVAGMGGPAIGASCVVETGLVALSNHYWLESTDRRLEINRLLLLGTTPPFELERDADMYAERARRTAQFVRDYGPVTNVVDHFVGLPE